LKSCRFIIFVEPTSSLLMVVGKYIPVFRDHEPDQHTRSTIDDTCGQDDYSYHNDQEANVIHGDSITEIKSKEDKSKGHAGV